MTDPYTVYDTQQAGHGMPVFIGSRTQRGHGLGAILGGLARMVAPIAKQALPVLKRQITKTGTGIISDIIQGKSVRKSVKRRAVEGGVQLVNDLVPHRSKKAKPIKRSRKNVVGIPHRGKQPNKRLRRDIFD